MIEWTETARRTLDDYCARTKAAVDGTGADANEVIDDLRRHIDEEVQAAGLTVVTEESIRRILARLGEPGASVERKTTAPPAPVPPEKTRPGFVLFLFGILLPLGTFLFEWWTGISAGVLFDPMPSWFHFIAIALVP